MGGGTLHRFLSEELDEWDFDFSRFEIVAFVAWVEKRRGRAIHLVPWRLPTELFGAWIEDDSADYIFYENEPLHVHTVHILLHELCHLLLGHRTIHAGKDLQHLLGAHAHLPEAEVTLRAALQQSAVDEQELEAETLSNLIQQRVYRQAGIAALSHAGDGLEMRQFMQGLGMDEAK
ncbi:MAG: hypothetical protein IT318_16400 [Anaerolineales bacterium]|nr:hypothetical protein [Anaerolineales bacterium]